MNEEKKPTQPADVSLKYMAWDHKTISKALERIADALEKLNASKQPELF